MTSLPLMIMGKHCCFIVFYVLKVLPVGRRVLRRHKYRRNKGGRFIRPAN